MSFEIEGKLIKKFDSEQKTGSFQTREFVIEIESGNYPQYVKFQLTQDRCNAIDAYQEGNAIKVHFDLRGREWQGKYFTNLNAWRIENANGELSTPTHSTPTPASKQNNISSPPKIADDAFPTANDEPVSTPYQDDLPF